MKKKAQKFNLLEVGATPVGEQVSRWKLVYLYIFLVGIFAFLFWQLFGLQVVEGDNNLLLAKTISRSSTPIRAPRGLIFDSDGQRLVVNIPAFTLYLNPTEIEGERESEVMDLVSEVLGMEVVSVNEKYQTGAYKDGEKIAGVSRVTIKSGLTNDDFLEVLPRINNISGIYLEEEALREYEVGEEYSHLLGYVGDASTDDVETKEVDPNSQVGKIGVEEAYDDVLRGVDGEEIVEVDARFETENIYIPQSAKSGDNLVLTIDSDWQKSLYKALGRQVDALNGYGGASIIMETGTGKIKAMVSYPSYDNNLFSKGIDSRSFTTLLTDDRTPLLNKAIGLQLPPGSTFKPILAAAALQEGSITPSTTYTSEGCMTLPGNIQFCEADKVRLGTMNVAQAIGKSSNVFFCNTGLALTENANGIRTLMEYADEFGIGHKTDIGLTGEVTGTMASPELMLKVHGRPWFLGDICNTAIGQGLVTTTPLQMLQVAEAVATNGKIYKPLLVDQIQDQSGEVVETVGPEIARQVSVDQKYFEVIKDGMYRAVNNTQGSAILLDGSPGNPYAKTGSSDATEYINGKPLKGAHSWVIGGFEYDGKEYNFVTHITLGGRGFKSVPVIKEFINCLYSDFAGSVCK